MGKKQTLTVPGHYAGVKQICQFIAQGAEEAGLGETAVYHIELACDEASANIIEHAYGAEGAGDIEISWHIANNFFVVTIHDNGRRFDPSQIPPPPSVKKLPQSDEFDTIKVGGLGIHFMRQMMDEVTFSYDLQRGNKLIMKKRIVANEDAG